MPTVSECGFEGMGTNGGCNEDSRAVDCETTPEGAGLRPIVLELHMPFSPEAGSDGVPGMFARMPQRLDIDWLGGTLA